MTNKPMLSVEQRELLGKAASLLEIHGDRPSLETCAADDLRALLDKPAPSPYQTLGCFGNAAEGWKHCESHKFYALREPADRRQGEPVAVVATQPNTGIGAMKLIELVAATITIWPADAHCFAQDSDGYCFSFRSEPLANGSCWDGRVASETFLAKPCVDRATTFVTRQQWEAYRLGFKQKSEQPAPVAVLMPERKRTHPSNPFNAEAMQYNAALDDVTSLNGVKP